MARVVDVHGTDDEASRKAEVHDHTENGRSRRVGWYSIRRVLEYSSSLRDTVISRTVPSTRAQGVRRGTAHPFESDKPPRNANAKEHAIKRLIQKSFRVYGYVL